MSRAARDLVDAPKEIRAVSISSDGTRAVTGSDDGTSIVWGLSGDDVTTWRNLKTLAHGCQHLERRHQGRHRER